MFYRAWIAVTDLPVDDEERWSPLIEWLEEERSDFGPVLSWWEEDKASIVMSAEADDEATAIEAMIRAVVDGLQAAGLTELKPWVKDVEVATDLEEIEAGD